MGQQETPSETLAGQAEAKGSLHVSKQNASQTLPESRLKGQGFRSLATVFQGSCHSCCACYNSLGLVSFAGIACCGLRDPLMIFVLAGWYRVLCVVSRLWVEETRCECIRCVIVGKQPCRVTDRMTGFATAIPFPSRQAVSTVKSYAWFAGSAFIVVALPVLIEVRHLVACVPALVCTSVPLSQLQRETTFAVMKEDEERRVQETIQNLTTNARPQ
jgi:hypothetical protein